LEVWAEEAAAAVGVGWAAVVVALEVAWVAPGVAAEVPTGILEEVTSMVVDGEAVTPGTTVVGLVVAGAQVVAVDQVIAVEVAIGAMTILMVAISRIMVEGLLEAALVEVVGEDRALIQVAVADMARVVAWEAMAEVRVDSELSQI
jgi:hypothetical protein